jgi:hypothetical protein
MSKSTNRSLPDDQVQIDDEEQYEEAEMQTMKRAMGVSKQFEEIKARTIDDGMILGKITDINTSPTNQKIVIEIKVPATDEPKQKRFQKPKRWTDDYAIVRWIQHYGYTADSFPNMVDDDCKVKVEEVSNGDGYEVFIPEKKKNWRDKISDPSIPPLYTTYKESGIPFFQGIGLVSFLITLGFTATGTVHLMPTKTEELIAILSFAIILILITEIEDDIQSEYR